MEEPSAASTPDIVGLLDQLVGSVPNRQLPLIDDEKRIKKEN